MIPLYPRPLPQRLEAIVDARGQPLPSFFFLQLALLNRTGGDSGLIEQIANDLTATGATQATALEVVLDVNEVLDGSGGVILKQLQPPQIMEVFNGTGGNINVYPPIGGEIDALGTNQPYVLANTKMQRFRCYSLLGNGVSFFRSLQLG